MMYQTTELVNLFGGLWWLLPLILVWSIVWKGLALWRAAGRGQKWWFIVLLVVNSAGILDIIYLFLVTGGFKKEEKKDTNNEEKSL